MIRLFVIDDHPIVIDGLNYLIRHDKDEIKIVGSALNLHEAIQKIHKTELDIVILDLYIPGYFVSDSVRALKHKFPEKKIIIFTIELSYLWERAMMREGVDGYLTKDLNDTAIISGIKKVYNSERVFFSTIEDNFNQAYARNKLPGNPVTTVQEKLIELLIDGLSVKQIGDVMGINIFKINYLLKKIRQKFKVKNNVELIATLLKQKALFARHQQPS